MNVKRFASSYADDTVDFPLFDDATSTTFRYPRLISSDMTHHHLGGLVEFQFYNFSIIFLFFLAFTHFC